MGEPKLPVGSGEAAARPEPTGHTTIDLLGRVRSGDQHALDVLFARFAPRLRRWATGRMPPCARDMSDTEDLVQETLLSTFRRLDSFHAAGPGALQAYLRQALLNRIRDQIRRWKRRPTDDTLDEFIEDAGASPLDQAIGRDAVERYERALARLKPEEREAIIARVEMGYSYRELAEALGKPTPDAARKTAERALVRLAGEMSHGD